MTEPQPVRVTDPGSVLSIVPLILGYQPAEGDLVLLGLGERGRLVMAMRVDAAHVDREAAGQLRGIMRNAQRSGARSAILVGYGKGEAITPAIDAAVPAAGDLLIADALRVEGNRYWSYHCTNLECCPAEGREFGAETAATTALRTHGLTAEPSREALAARIAAPQGERAEAARQAWERALRAPLSVDSGRRAVQEALTGCRAGKTLDNDDAARLAAAMRMLPVRDDAWARMTPEHADEHLALWTDVVRRVPDAGLAGPATLLAWCAWQKGNGALANMAIDRALEATPEYSMATLVRHALSAGLPPTAAVPPMTPAEVADSYRAQARHQPEIEHPELEAG
jgi:hypothetical protein